MGDAVNAERQSMQVDVACVGFGPATAGFLTTLSRTLADKPDDPAFQSRVMPGMPLQVLCYERADDVGFGVSGVVTRARAIRQSFPDLDPSHIPTAAAVSDEKLVYMLDPIGASRRSTAFRAADKAIRALDWPLRVRDDAVELPVIPRFLSKEDGLVFSIGQFTQWAASQLMATGLTQIWPGMPVSQALIEDDCVVGVRLVDQGTDRTGSPEAGYMPGMDIRADLTVVGDGPVGPVGLQLDEHFGLPQGNVQRDWAVGMKMVVDLPDDSPLQPGTVLHTLGYPEPEIFGFLYVYAERTASLGIFVPSWLPSPIRTAYRHLQHWMLHPYLRPVLRGATMRSWGAKTLQEAGRRGEPHLVGDGYARIGEGSGSTNILTGSGVDEAWATGVHLADSVIELLRSGEPITKGTLDATYVRRRRASWLDDESRVAERSRDGFHKGVLTGLVGMGLAGATSGKLALRVEARRPHDHTQTLADYFKGTIPATEAAQLRDQAAAAGAAAHDALLERSGWPAIPHDGELLVSQQDALLMGGKVQAPPGYADHVVFLDEAACRRCSNKVCIEICSGQAILPGDQDGLPTFDREKCIHCGACLWSCTQPRAGDPERTNIAFRAGTGGLHSVEN